MVQELAGENGHRSPDPSDPLNHVHTLCRSPHITVDHEFETVWAHGPGVPGQPTIGDFFGDPFGAAIDDAERWCVMVGCGVIVYKLAPPWQDYNYDLTTDQWWEAYREPDDILWMADVRHVGGALFACEGRRDANEFQPYLIDAEARTVTPAHG